MCLLWPLRESRMRSPMLVRAGACVAAALMAAFVHAPPDLDTALTDPDR